MTKTLSPTTLGTLLDQHGRPLQQYARQWSLSPEDIVQEAFVRLAQQTPPPENPTAWLYRVTRNLAINDLRSEQRRRSHELAKNQLTESSGWERESTQLDAQAVAQVLSQLAEETQELITLRIWGKLTWQQIADVLGISSSSAHRKYNEAIQQLKALWGHHV